MAKTKLVEGTVPKPYKAFLTSDAHGQIANNNIALFNPSAQVSAFFRKGQFSGPALGIESWYEDENIATHQVGALGPHHRGPVAPFRVVRHGQKSKWSGGQETFLRHAPMGTVMNNRRDNRSLGIVPFGDIDTGPAPNEGVATIRADNEARGNGLPTVETDTRQCPVMPDFRHFGRGQQAESRPVHDPVQQRPAQQPVLDDMTERRGTHVLMVKMNKAGRVAVGHADVQHRLGRRSQRRPQV